MAPAICRSLGQALNLHGSHQPEVLGTRWNENRELYVLLPQQKIHRISEREMSVKRVSSNMRGNA